MRACVSQLIDYELYIYSSSKPISIQIFHVNNEKNIFYCLFYLFFIAFDILLYYLVPFF